MFTEMGNTQRRHRPEVEWEQSMSLILERLYWHGFDSHILLEILSRH